MKIKIYLLSLLTAFICLISCDNNGVYMLSINKKWMDGAEKIYEYIHPNNITYYPLTYDNEKDWN